MKISRTLVETRHRMSQAFASFGNSFPIKVEPTVYSFTDKIAAEYTGGYWEFYVLSNDGFYMVPNADNYYRISCDNGYEGVLSADALGITVCLYAYSHLSFTGGSMAEVYATQYHWLRDYMLCHSEAENILKAID